MNATIGWYHPEDESDQWDGFNEAGIEHFSGSPLRHLAREVNQNSLDSNLHGATVRVQMQVVDVDAKSIPGYQELLDNLQLCRNAAEEESTKAKLFFENAIADLKKSTISVLQISDYNTTGIKGPSTNGNPFYAFMKAKGQSKKESNTATGSFGIGKFAPYAVSKLRTVFVSTIYKDDKTNQYNQLTQGKSILMSHDDETTRRQGIGFWGIKKKCQPVELDTVALPDWVQRMDPSADISQQCGTKLSILGFNKEQGWETNLAVSVAENFFGAIYSGSLEVEIQQSYMLNRETITAFFDSADVRSQIENQKNEPEHFDNCRSYLQALKDSIEVTVEDSEKNNLGLTELRIYLNEGLPKKVCFLRNGMFISDELSLPGLKLFSDFKEFVAVVQCKNPKGNELLRGMEPPRHDDFEPDRLPTPDLQKKGSKALKDLSKWVRDMLKRHAKNPVSDITSLDELKEFFADEEGEGSGSGTEDINPSGRITIRAKPVAIKTPANQPVPVPVEGTSSGSEGGEGGGGSDGAGGGDGQGGVGSGSGGVGTSGASSTPQVAISNIRAITTSASSRRISFTPLSSGEVLLRVLEAGADSDYDISIAQSDVGNVKNGCLHLSVEKNQRITLNVTLNDSFDGALKVVANEIR